MKLSVGIDIGKDTLVVALSSERERQLGKRADFANAPGGFKKLAAFVETQRNGFSIHSVSEATGVYGLKLVDFLLGETDWKVSVMNPFQIKSFRDSRLVKTKTDATDAFELAQFGLMYDPPGFVPQEPEFKELEQIIGAMAGVQKIWNEERNQLHAYSFRPIKNPETMAMKVRRIEEAELDAGRLLQEAIRVASQRPEIRRYIDLLCTIPGIGEHSAVLLLPTLVKMSPAMPDCRKLLSYAGLVPQEKQSGTSVRGRTRMSKKGNVWVRRALYMPTLTAVRYNPVIRTLYLRMVAAGMPKKKAVVSCMPRLLRLAWGVFRHQRPFEVKNWGGTVDTKIDEKIA